MEIKVPTKRMQDAEAGRRATLSQRDPFHLYDDPKKEQAVSEGKRIVKSFTKAIQDWEKRNAHLGSGDTHSREGLALYTLASMGYTGIRWDAADHAEKRAYVLLKRANMQTLLKDLDFRKTLPLQQAMDLRKTRYFRGPNTRFIPQKNGVTPTGRDRTY